MREIRSSGSAEGVMGNCDPYSDPPERLVVNQSLLGSREPTLLCHHLGAGPSFVRLPARLAPVVSLSNKEWLLLLRGATFATSTFNNSVRPTELLVLRSQRTIH